jgi:UDPglucose--hexose-1-phosphate uridylyltransferase
MNTMLKFNKEVVYTDLLDPRESFRPQKVETEIRTDPLTGETGRLAHFGVIRMQKEDFLAWDTPENRSQCPFCPENLERVTPQYPPEFIPEGRLKRGQTTIIPNIAPYDQYSALAVMSRAHIVPLKKMTAPLLRDALGAGLDFARRAAARENGRLPYQVMIWNYMPPSGGGLVHPHLQIIVTGFPGNLYRKTMENGQRFYQKHSKNYWQELCTVEEKLGKRYIGSLGAGHWLTPFVPQGILGEFIVVFPEIKTIADCNEETLQDLVAGLQRLFAYFREMGIASFNMGLFFAPEGEAEKYFSLHARFVPRTYLNPREKPSDINAMQMSLQEPVTVIHPETQCAELKELWAKWGQ